MVVVVADDDRLGFRSFPLAQDMRIIFSVMATFTCGSLLFVFVSA